MTPQREAWMEKCRARIWKVLVREKRIRFRDLMRMTSYSRGPLPPEDGCNINAETWYDAVRSLAGRVAFESEGGGMRYTDLAEVDGNRFFVVLTPPQK